MPEESEQRRDQLRRRAGTAVFFLVAAALAIGVPLLLAWLAILRDPRGWGWSEWVAQLTQILTGVIFFGLAWFVGRGGDRRAQASANAELITSMGALSMSSARSYAGNDAQALHIGADARAALQHYPRARYQEQVKLVQKIIDSYSDLSFGTFCRAQGLPRSTWNGLCDSAADVVLDTRALAESYARRSPARRQDLEQMLEHVEFAVSLGRQARSQGRDHDGMIVPGHPRILEKIWIGPDGTVCPTRDRILRLKRLYRRELTVVHDWGVLLVQPERVHCSATLYDVADSGEWYAPWYLQRVGETGALEPVNVHGQALGDEAARYDQVPDRPDTATYPQPLRHSKLPGGLREPAIENQVTLLENSPSVTLCVLSYELICDDAGHRRRIVLDGNHRLAAARRIADRNHDLRLRVLEFLIRENERVEDEVRRPVEYPDWAWQGFTPDIEVARSAWGGGPQDRAHRR